MFFEEKILIVFKIVSITVATLNYKQQKQHKNESFLIQFYFCKKTISKLGKQNVELYQPSYSRTEVLGDVQN